MDDDDGTPRETEEGASEASEARPRADQHADPSLRRLLGDRLSTLLDGRERRPRDVLAGIAKGSTDEIRRIVAEEIRKVFRELDLVAVVREALADMEVEVEAKLKLRQPVAPHGDGADPDPAVPKQ